MSSSCRPELLILSLLFLFYFFILCIFPCFYILNGVRGFVLCVCVSGLVSIGVMCPELEWALLTRESSQTVTLPRCPFPVAAGLLAFCSQPRTNTSNTYNYHSLQLYYPAKSRQQTFIAYIACTYIIQARAPVICGSGQQ